MNIEHFPEKKVFQTVVDGETARLMYHVADGALDVRHTIVPGEIGGRGIASALVKAAYDYALANELVPVATCSYAVKWLERHPEYNGKTGKDYAGRGLVHYRNSRSSYLDFAIFGFFSILLPFLIIH